MISLRRVAFCASLQTEQREQIEILVLRSKIFSLVAPKSSCWFFFRNPQVMREQAVRVESERREAEAVIKNG